MSLTAGIVGLPNVGKSTLFNAITQSKVEAANYPFATIDKNVGVVEVKDKRVDRLSEMYQPKKTIYTTFEFTDIAGLVKGASKGEGLGNQFLANIREVDAIIHVVRCFENSDITHVEDRIDSVDDVAIIDLELQLADLTSVENRLSKLERKAKNGDKSALEEVSLCQILRQGLESGLNVLQMELSDSHRELVKSYQLLTSKPVIYVGNVLEDEVTDPFVNKEFVKLTDLAKQRGTIAIAISAKMEEELSELESDEKELYLSELGIEQSGLDVITKAAYDLLGLRTFFTVGTDEVRAWTFKQGMKAPQTAGVIHTDFEKGFIRAETMSYDDLMKYQTEQAVKEAGRLRLEGKEYLVNDGDILHFRFNV